MIGLVLQYLINTTAHGFNRLLNGPARGNGGRFRKLWAVAIAVAFTTAGVVIDRSKRALDADPIATNFKYGLLEVIFFAGGGGELRQYVQEKALAECKAF